MIASMLAGVVLLTALGAQSDVEGAWQATYTTPEGRAHQFTLTLKVAADGAIAGTIASHRGSVAITKGSVTGRDIAFTVTRRASYDEIDVVFTGTIDGDRMQLTMRMGEREPIAVTAVRQGASSSQRPLDASSPRVASIAVPGRLRSASSPSMPAPARTARSASSPAR